MALKAKKTITIPSSVKHKIVPQLGVGSYSTYPFSSSSDCATVRKMWKTEGSKHSGHIATVGGAFCVAMTATFGRPGEVLEVILNDKKGTKFWVIICDAKNMSDSNCTKWGHKYGGNGAVDILEWYGDFTGSVSNEISQLKSTLDKKGYLNKKIKKIINYGAYKKGMKLEGGADAAEVFIEEARKHVGSGGHAWVQSMTSIGNQAWCGATMCAVAIETGFAGKIMPKHDYTAHGFGKKIVTEYGGTYIKAYKQGEKNPKVQPGDIAEFQYVNENRHGVTGKWASHHVAVVSKVNKDGTYTVIHGNWSNKYQECKVKKSEIGWFARPDWDKVGGTSVGTGLYNMTGDGPALYQTSSTRADAILRDSAYINKKQELVVKPKNAVADLSVINYTTLAATLVAAFGGSSGDSGDDDDDDVGSWDLKKIKNKRARKLVSILIDEGFPPCSACGIVGNIYVESDGFKTGAVSADGANSIGLCQWTGDRAVKMKKFVGDDWANDFEGQCRFLLEEMKAYSDMVKTLKNYKNTEANCRKATQLFCDKFERPSIPHMKRRKDYAVSVWKKIKASGFDGGKFQWPVPGHYTVSSGRGARWGAWHQGIDIPAPVGTKIVAGEAGKVYEVTENGGQRGKYVLLDHGNKWYTRYQHNSKNCVKKGDKVTRGQKIAEVGKTGFATGPHLHFEVLKGGTRSNNDYPHSKNNNDVNPMKYLKPKKS